jgi:hypothetical protein
LWSCSAPATISDAEAEPPLISTITGKSVMGSVGGTGGANALIDVKEQASGLGATHIVVQSVDEGSMSSPGIARAKAYKCN